MTTSRDTRWLAFGLLVLGFVLVIYGGLAEWLAYADYTDRRELWGFRHEVWLWMAVPLVALGSGVVFAMAVGARRNYVPAPAVLFVLAGVALVALVAAIASIAHASGKTVEVRSIAPDPRWGLYDYKTSPVKFSLAPWLELVGLAATIGATTWLGWISRQIRLRAAGELDRANREQAKRAGDVIPSDEARLTPADDDVPRL